MDQQLDQELVSHLTALEESLWIGSSRFDDALMDKTFASDFVEVGRSGQKYSRDEMLFGIEYAGQTIDAELPLPELEIRALADDVVQITYVSRVAYDGEIEEGHRSSIWSFSDGRWQLRFHQGTPVYKG